MKRIYEYEDLQPVIEQLLEEKESYDLEFKSAKGGFPHSMWETYSSFANTDGGAIVFGIREKDDRFYLDGLTKEQARKYQKEFFNGMHNKKVVNIPLLKENDVQAVEFGGAYFLFFYIPRVDRSLKPVYCGLDPYTGISNERLQYALEMHKADITQMLGKMCKQRLLEASGRGRGTTYHVYGAGVYPTGKVATLDGNMALTMETLSTNMGTLSTNMDTSSANMDTLSANMDTSKNHIALSKRYSKEQLRMLLKEICKDWRTAEEIAIALGRATKYIKNFVLP